MKQRLIIIDDFYTDPYAVREYALATSYHAYDGHTYPGENSVEPLILPGTVDAFKRILGQHIEPSREGVFGQFRVSLESDTFEQDVHVDPSNTPGEHVWVGVLYLNTPTQCKRPDGSVRDGTNVWRHKELDLEHVPSSPEEGKALGFNTYDEVRAKLIEGDGNDRSKWELLHRVPMKFNRIAFFRPTDWHSHGENFGINRENGRLVQIFFFRSTKV
jgi:hypothetical protein